MKVKRILEVLSFTILMLFIFTGCAPKEGQMLLDAFNKQSKIKSYEQKVEMTVNVDSSNNYDAAMLSILNNAILTIDSKQDLVNSKQFANTAIDLGGIVMNVPIYSDLKKTLIKPPFERKYVEISTDELAQINSGLSNTPKIAITPEKQKELQQKMQTLISKFISAYAIEHPEAFQNISSKGIQTLTTPEGSKQVSVIEIKFNDEDFKTFVLNTLDDVSNSNSFKEFSKSTVELLPEIIESYGLTNDYEMESFVNELKNTQNDFDSNYDTAIVALKEYLPQLKNDIDKYFEIGSDGVILTYYIDNNGYITKTNAVIDCIFKQPSYYDETTADQIRFTLKIDSLIYNINKTTVENPVATDTKTIPVKEYVRNSEFLKNSTVADILGVKPIHTTIYLEENDAYLNYSYYQFNTSPYLKNGNLMLPADFIKKALRLELSTDDTSGTIILSDDSKSVILTTFSKQAYVNNKTRFLPVAPEMVNGEYMIPLRFIANQFGGEVNWDSYEYEDYYGVNQVRTTISITKN